MMDADGAQMSPTATELQADARARITVAIVFFMSISWERQAVGVADEVEVRPSGC
jgi:hypothetical protein